MNPFSIFQIHVVVKLPNKGKLLIPHSGLRTKFFVNRYGKQILMVSPSHAVGLERKRKTPTVVCYRDIESPSHTVGLKLQQHLEMLLFAYFVSIPHSGLETIKPARLILRDSIIVSIPHSGLRT